MREYVLKKEKENYILKLPLCWISNKELGIGTKQKYKQRHLIFFAKHNITLNIIADNFPCLIDGREAGIWK